jgi:hypothetical protein
VPQRNGIRGSKDLRAKVGKFLILTNERKKMSKTTLRKRISLVAVTALTAGVLSVVSSPVANANLNGIATQVFADGELGVATGTNVTGATVVTGAGTGALSLGLLYKDASSTTAQTATALTSGALVLGTKAHASLATAVAFVVSGGTLGTAVGGGGTQAVSAARYSADLRTATLGGTNSTMVAIRWALPSTAGTYTVSAYRSTNAANVNFTSASDTTDVVANGAIIGAVTVTVVASAPADGPVVAYSTCTTFTSGTVTPASTDHASAFVNGDSAYINMKMVNALLQANTLEGNIVATSSSADAHLSIGGTSVTAGTGTTVVAYGTAVGGDDSVVRVKQATAGKPVTTTVTITFNGAVICTKTITIRGEVASMAISNVAAGDSDGAGAATASWLADGTLRDGHMYIQLKDSAGNTVLPGNQTSSNTGNAEFSIDTASVTNLVTAFTVASGDQATSLSSSAVPYNYSVGKYTCGSSQYGTQKVTIKHTSAATGKITTGTFDARCAGDAYTYTASFDKASYNQGEIATLTVKFFDSKGNAANSIAQVGTSQLIIPMMTFVSATGTASTITKADGTVAYTLTVGTTAGMTAGTYSGIVDFTDLTAVAATKQTVTYKLSTGGDTTTNADVLKSIVALIASINKQIQALQKLILKR